MTSSTSFADIGQAAGYEPVERLMKEHLVSMSAAARMDVIIDLSAKLEEMSSLARRFERCELEVMLADLSRSFRSSAKEIAAASYGLVLIERMSASVGRLESNFTA